MYYMIYFMLEFSLSFVQEAPPSDVSWFKRCPVNDYFIVSSKNPAVILLTHITYHVNLSDVSF